MSTLSLENWNPMAEDYASSSLNSFNEISPLYDTSSLYVKNIPKDLTRDTFLSIMSEEGSREVKRYNVFSARPHSDTTIGLASYESAADALHVMRSLNKKSPFYFEIDYARKSDKNSAKDKNANFPGQGRGRPLQPDTLHAIKVEVSNGAKRITYDEPAFVEIMKHRSKSPDIPSLLPIFCGVCKKKAELSCGLCQQPYCSARCQLQDWSRHKPLCKSLSNEQKIANDSSYMSEGSSCSDSDKKKDNERFPSARPGLLPTPTMKPSSDFNRPHQSLKEGVQGRNQKFIRADEIQKIVLPPDSQQKVTVCSIVSPSKFWVHLDGANKVLSLMGKEIAAVEKISLKFSVGDVCCTIKNGRWSRVQVLEMKYSSSLVQFIDYGETATVTNNQLYHLPHTFKINPLQALCCNLVDGADSETIEWTKDDISSFEFHTKDKALKAHVHRCSKNVHDVTLVNDEGVSLYSVLSFPGIEALEGYSGSSISDVKVPTVWRDLKVGDKANVTALEFEGDKFWGLLDDGSDCLRTIGEIENLLRGVETEEVNMTCEEGDVVAGYSLRFSQFYRCVVLKRLRSSFQVRFIDYGNQEEVMKLHSLTPNLLRKKTYVVCCEKPTSISQEQFNAIFEKTLSVVVKNVAKNTVELQFNNQTSELVMNCFPWYHGVTALNSVNEISKQPDLSMSKSQGPTKAFGARQSPRKRIHLPDSKHALSIASENKPNLVKIMKNSLSDKKLNVGMKYTVKVAWIKTASEMYVHLETDEMPLVKLSKDLNQFCNSESDKNGYTPSINEVVSCKYSDGIWYRGLCLGENNSKFRVIFVDYGNEDYVCASDIKPLPQKFALPKLSVCVALHKIRNEDISKKLLDKLVSEAWVMEVKDAEKSPLEVMLYLKGKSLVELLENKSNHLKSSLKFQKLPCGKTTDVVICFADAERLYVHQQKDLRNLEALQKNINSIEKTPISKMPVIGMVYSCLSTDGCWYRASVLEIVSPKAVRVQYIDYGNLEEIPISNLKEITNQLFSHPVYCIPVVIQGIKLSELKLDEVYTLEVTGEMSDVQEVKFFNLPKDNFTKYPTVSVLKSLSLEEGMSEIVCFAHIEKDVHYCHLRSQAKSYALMREKLLSPELKPLSQNPAVGDLVCAKSVDQYWYRASIQSVSNDGSTFKVLFIDYGNSEVVTSSNVKCIPDELLQFPIFCIPLKITNKGKNEIDSTSMLPIKVIGSDSDKIKLAELVLPVSACIPTLDSLTKQMLPMDEVTHVSICYIEEDIFYVQLESSKKLIAHLELELTQASSFDNVESLPKVGSVVCAKFTDGVYYRASVVEACDPMCKVYFIDFGNCEQINLENMKILPHSLGRLPVFGIPVKFKNIEDLQKQVEAGVSIFTVRVAETSSEKIPIVDIVLPEEDIELSSITSQVLPESPIVVLVCHREGEVIYVQKVSDAEKLQDMMTDLQSPASMKSLSRPPKIMELLNVKFNDGQFYRGIVKEKCDKNSYKVEFVDFGNTDVVDVKDIYCLPSKYSSLPMLGIPVMFKEGDDITVLSTNPVCTIKHTGAFNGKAQIVQLCPVVPQIQLSSLERDSFVKNEMYDVTFTSTDGKFHFLRKTSNSDLLNEMNSLLKTLKIKEIYHIPIVGEVLVIKYQGNTWHRGCIKAVSETSRTCRVDLIDSGVTVNISFPDISYMPERLSAFPIFCIKVSIENEIAIESVSFEKTYCIKVIGKTSDDVFIVQMCKRYMVNVLKHQCLPLNELRNVIFFHQEGEKYYLQDVSNASLVTEVQSEAKKIGSTEAISHTPIVGELLCAQSQADGTWYRCCVKEIVSCDRFMIHFLDFGNDEVVSKESLRSFTGELTMYPSYAIAVKICNNSSPKPKVELEKLYSVIAESAEDDVQSVKVVLLHSTHIDMPPDDACVVVEKEADDSTAKFFYSNANFVSLPPGEHDIVIYCVSDDGCVFCAPYSPEGIAANLQYSTLITEYCEGLQSSSFNGKDYPAMDELVLAKFDEDGQWYRAVVLDNSSHPEYDVVFVDYGNSERINLESIRKMEKQFMSLDMQTQLCQIEGFDINEEMEPKVIEELKKFTVFLNPSPLKAIVSLKGEDISVNIPVITHNLIEKKLVVASQS